MALSSTFFFQVIESREMMDESKDRDAIDGAVRVAHLVKHASFFISNCPVSTPVKKKVCPTRPLIEAFTANQVDTLKYLP